MPRPTSGSFWTWSWQLITRQIQTKAAGKLQLEHRASRPKFRLVRRDTVCSVVSRQDVRFRACSKIAPLYVWHVFRHVRNRDFSATNLQGPKCISYIACHVKLSWNTGKSCYAWAKLPIVLQTGTYHISPNSTWLVTSRLDTFDV